MPANVISGFEAAGLYRFQPDKWNDQDLYLTQVTDRPDPNRPNSDNLNSDITNPNETSQQIKENCTSFTTVYQLPCNSNNIPLSDQQSSSSVTPETVRPFPKAEARKQAKGRKKSSAILTDTPVKEQLQNEQTERKLKKLIKQTRIGLLVKTLKVAKFKVAAKARKLTYDLNNNNCSC